MSRSAKPLRRLTQEDFGSIRTTSSKEVNGIYQTVEEGHRFPPIDRPARTRAPRSQPLIVPRE